MRCVVKPRETGDPSVEAFLVREFPTLGAVFWERLLAHVEDREFGLMTVGAVADRARVSTAYAVGVVCALQEQGVLMFRRSEGGGSLWRVVFDAGAA